MSLLYFIFIKRCFLDETNRVSASLNSRGCIEEHQFYEEPDSAYPYENLSLRHQGVALFFQSNVRPSSSEIKHLGEMQAASTEPLMSDQIYSLASMHVHKKDDCTEDITP